MNPNFKEYLLKVTRSSGCEEVEVIQSLWSGYGKISRYRLVDSTSRTVVVKYIALSRSNQHPRGWNTDISHNRKVESYRVETHWYEAWSQRSTSGSRIPKSIGSFADGKDQWIIMEDLNEEFPVRKGQINFSEINVCLTWLANFHATFLGYKPEGLWEVGTYWHLETRPDELKKMEHRELKAKAHMIDALLNECKYQTIVHGDAKLANFCFSKDGANVAAVDFQYVGGGCGMKDVAYFLGSCLSGHDCELYEDELLDYYFLEFKNTLVANAPSIDFKALEEEWRAMYSIACTDFTRFLLGWMPTHQKINNYNLKIMKSVLADL